jgi:hypothetical protein
MPVQQPQSPITKLESTPRSSITLKLRKFTGVEYVRGKIKGSRSNRAAGPSIICMLLERCLPQTRHHANKQYRSLWFVKGKPIALISPGLSSRRSIPISIARMHMVYSSRSIRRRKSGTSLQLLVIERCEAGICLSWETASDGSSYVRCHCLGQSRRIGFLWVEFLVSIAKTCKMQP